jgi:outer membrane lipoprotein-sorting protein
MKRFVMIFVMTLVVSSAGLAQAPAPKPAEPAGKPAEKAAALPTVDAILENYVKALGGKEAIQKVTSYSMKGKIELPAMSMSGPAELVTKAPNKMYSKMTIEGFGDILQGYDGKVAWAQDPMQGLRELSGVELVALKIGADFYKDLRMKELYKSLTVKGREKVGDASAIVVEAVPSEGDPSKYYFDENTWLVIRMDSVQEGPQGKMPGENYSEDYRVVGGVKVPHRVRIVNPAFAITITLSEVTANAAVDDAKFAKPAAK